MRRWLNGTTDGPTKKHHAKLLVVDEAAFTKKELFTRTIAPMVLVDETTLVCISTANENPTAHYQALVNRKDERNEEFLRTFTFTNICPKCAAIGLKTCKHDASVLTAWTSRRKKKLTKALMGDEDGDYDREILGLNIQGSNAVFSQDKIGMLFASTERELRGEQIDGVIFVTIGTQALFPTSPQIPD